MIVTKMIEHLRIMGYPNLKPMSNVLLFNVNLLYVALALYLPRG